MIGCRYVQSDKVTHNTTLFHTASGTNYGRGSESATLCFDKQAIKVIRLMMMMVVVVEGIFIDGLTAWLEMRSGSNPNSALVHTPTMTRWPMSSPWHLQTAPFPVHGRRQWY